MDFVVYEDISLWRVLGKLRIPEKRIECNDLSFFTPYSSLGCGWDGRSSGHLFATMGEKAQRISELPVVLVQVSFKKQMPKWDEMCKDFVRGKVSVKENQEGAEEDWERASGF